MKAYTDLEQSKKLAEILPLESADMVWISIEDDESFEGAYEALPKWCSLVAIDDNTTPCWSFSALLDILPLEIDLHKQSDGNMEYYYMEYTTRKSYFATKRYTNPIDAAFEMICWVKENNKL